MTVTETHRRSVFERLAGWSQRHRWTALLLWVLVLAGVTAGARLAGSDFRNDFTLPGAESQQAQDLLADRAPIRAGGSLDIVVRAPGGMSEPSTREAVDAMLTRIRALPHVAEVVSPYPSGSFPPTAISADGTIGYATVALDVPAEAMPADATRRIIETARASGSGSADEAAGSSGLTVEVGGDPARAAEEAEGGAAEGAGLLAALVVLVLLFGSLLAASLPIIIAVFAVGSAIGLVTLASHVATVADFTTPLLILVGLGVGIDYALLVFSRFRGELTAGADRSAAVRTALDTAGRTVFFAGTTVIIALLGLVLLGLGALQGVAVALAVTVLVTMLAALVLLPALLGFFGARLERTMAKRAEKAARSGRAPRDEGRLWRRWSNAVARRPWPAILLPLVALIGMSAPVVGMRLGFADAGNDAESKTSTRAYHLLAEGFGPGVNGPLVLVITGGGQPVQSAARAVQQAVAATPGVAGTIAPMVASGGDLATVIAFPESAPQDEATQNLVDTLRGDALATVARDHDVTVLVGGPTAAVIDVSAAIADRLPLFIAVVVGLSALLLLVLFRSLLIPVKAAVLNLLSVGAAMGLVTWVFQHGAFGVPPGPIEAYVPVMIFAIVFGLSMDYEVFLLARMHEEWEKTRDAVGAVREGLATTGRVVTAAAAIMVVVFGAFLLSPDRMLQQFGLGLAAAVLIDAVVIRCLLLPAVMHVFGARAWWLPAGLARRLPRLALEHR
ncbi:putative integral membrane protein [Actinoplanes missouriensis 431]|uniref:Putative integral membrane protein n=1 Tax=Actinoplanes missouriensis (strain ATCC 14538 / DSM 43046 / CBS 188.64 / JCM 3121 / NBRC 102363 / NCIMB 12654 / NRRL B-3342 / UNCC 431) TaxID=512565 RepID=I0H3N4_ACTM4|nr:MMPL family transporter [Actinoplanes missouriensis]BAL87621.1 putative integral membrane protein [Actinoplanes missouriensis 431]